MEVSPDTGLYSGLLLFQVPTALHSPASSVHKVKSAHKHWAKGQGGGGRGGGGLAGVSCVLGINSEPGPMLINSLLVKQFAETSELCQQIFVFTKITT